MSGISMKSTAGYKSTETMTPKQKKSGGYHYPILRYPMGNPVLAQKGTKWGLFWLHQKKTSLYLVVENQNADLMGKRKNRVRGVQDIRQASEGGQKAKKRENGLGDHCDIWIARDQHADHNDIVGWGVRTPWLGGRAISAGYWPTNRGAKPQERKLRFGSLLGKALLSPLRISPLRSEL